MYNTPKKDLPILLLITLIHTNIELYYQNVCVFAFDPLNLKIKSHSERQTSIYLGLKNSNSEDIDSGQNPNSVSLVGENREFYNQREETITGVEERKGKKFSVGVNKLSYLVIH